MGIRGRELNNGRTSQGSTDRLSKAAAKVLYKKSPLHVTKLFDERANVSCIL